MKKIVITCCALLLSTSVVSANFYDVSETDQFADAINYVKTAGYVTGYPDTSYKPDNEINRAEFTKIIVDTFSGGGFSKGYNKDYPNSGCEKKLFPDAPLKEWFGIYVCAARDSGFIDGYADGTFKPSGKINYAEAAKIIAKAYDPDGSKGYTNKQSSIWYETFTDALKDRNAEPSTITSPSKFITRGEMAYMIWKFEGLGISLEEQLRNVQDNAAIVVGTSVLKSKIYTVDGFVEGGFKDGNNVYINIKSIMCYNNSCGFEGGGKWSIGANSKDSESFFPYVGKSVDMIIKVDSGCTADAKACNDIKNVSIVLKDSAAKYETTAPTSVKQFIYGTAPADVKPAGTTSSISVYFRGNPNSLIEMTEYYLKVLNTGKWYGPFKGRLMGEMQ